MEAVRTLSLKRRFEEVDGGSPFSTPKDSDDDISSSDSAESCDSLNPPSSTSLTPTSILRRQDPALGRKRVRFGAVTVFYFSRRQGFTSVPSQGGSSLGMARRHSSTRRYTLGEFAREQESSHRQALRQHLRQEKLDARKRKLTRNGTVECAAAERLTLDDVSDEDLDVDGVEVDDCFFLQPLPIKRRRALLRASGIARIDAREKAELRAIRLSREECGCDCRVYCDPQHCGCSQAGIKCQVDRMSFPCGCSRDGCRNAAGRVEFNPLRVRTHYLHTIMKLDVEKRRQLAGRAAEGPGEAEPAPAPAPTAGDPGADVCTEATLAEGADSASQELENETAVLHLQSAEEQERRREQEEGEGPLQEVGGASLLCFTEGQALVKDPPTLLYYQLGHAELAALGLPRLHAEEQEETLGGGGGGGGGGGEGEQEEGESGSSQQGLDECLLDAGPCSAEVTGDEDGLVLPQQEPAPLAFEGEGSPPPPEA
ncbi:cysteine/serine-rich nuclear protein 2 [Megalops cyprinoides]|uniref:cysteine/serine-rich nuclear protein 2 n=1 Tax=Megalops cyprinoides TaxID=118141 RepID=UPI0018651945|nr:cysteine/serine-rich nuclear protein 2 [Megalops cyprinoides]